VGDRFTEDGNEWELTEHPEVMPDGKRHRPRVRMVDEPLSVREMVSPSYRRVGVVRRET
jgi:hypothetical protein